MDTSAITIDIFLKNIPLIGAWRAHIAKGELKCPHCGQVDHFAFLDDAIPPIELRTAGTMIKERGGAMRSVTELLIKGSYLEAERYREAINPRMKCLGPECLNEFSVPGETLIAVTRAIAEKQR